MGFLLRLVKRHAGAAARRSIPRPALIAGGAIPAGFALIIVLAVGGVTASAATRAAGLASGILLDQPDHGGQPAGAGIPTTGPAPDSGGQPASSTAGAQAAFSRIILPDLLIVLPKGLTGPQISGLREIKGVRNIITFDGAEVTADGHKASVIGVSPSVFRSWVPLGTATDQRLWTDLAAGDFIESSQATGLPVLSAGRRYLLTGSSSVRVPFAATARIGIAGVDLLVNQALSARLGLVHRVAALISAPGPSVGALTAQVRTVLGVGARVVDLRDSRLPVTTTKPGQISSYLQLFRASAAKYCPAMSWTILAAIGQIESADGQNVGPSSAGALGPMQFLPSTWAEWGIDGFGPAGTPDIMNPMDAVPSAARMLCADGASSGTQAGLRQAIFAYNHADWYVNEVLALAAEYAAEYR